MQKSDAEIFDILIFRNFSGGQSPNFCPNGRKQHFDKIILSYKLKCEKVNFYPILDQFIRFAKFNIIFSILSIPFNSASNFYASGSGRL